MGRRRPKKRPPPHSESENEAGKEEEEAPMLPVGAEVEVRSDDPGFAGSFYEATVAGHLISSAGRRYTLAYSTLLAEEGGPHKETAAAADVRPRPPPEENAGAAPARRGFAICDMVEAFHNEGWWRAGVVSAVPLPVAGDGPRGVYKVTFPTSRETMEFEETALRRHRVFQDGRWVLAAELDNGNTLFSEGNQVEVRPSAQTFSESWSPATVFKVIGGHFFVQYIHIEKNGESATEIVDSQYIRPARIITCMDSRYRFSPSTHVEVFHQGSWWPGVIVEVLHSGTDKKYAVKLKNHGTDMEDMDCVGVLTVENTQLRPQFDWDSKKWVRCKKEKPAKGSRPTAKKRPISAAFALYDEVDEFKPGSYRDKKLKKVDIVSESIYPLLSARNEKYEINHMSWSYPEETMEQRKAVSALGSPLSHLSLPPMGAHLAPSCHLEQSSQMIIIPQGPFLGTQSRNSDCSQIVLTGQEKHSTVGRRTDMSRQEEECVAFQTPDALGESTESAKKGIAAKTIEEDDDISAIFEDLAELPNDMTAGREILSEMNRASCIDLTPRKYIRGSQERSGVLDLQQGGYAGETSVVQDTGEDLCKRYLVMADDANDRLYIDNTPYVVECMPGCVTPAEDLPIISPADGVVPNLIQSDVKLEVDITDDMVEENHQGNVVGSPTNGNQPQYANVDIPFSTTPLAALEGDVVITGSPTKELSDSSKSIEKSTVTRLSSVGMGNCTETEPDNRLAIIKSVEGIPISKYVASRTHDSCCPLLPESVDVNESIIDMNGPLSESSAIQHAPFVKTSPIWAKLEALKIFSRVPQRPNFHLVRQHVPELREGLAIGLMISFAFLAESINRLEVQDEIGPLEQKMLALSLLEANGFDVRDMRSHLKTLLDTSNRRIELRGAMEKLEQKIAHKETEDRELGAQIRNLAVAVHHLELHAYVMRDVMRSAISQKMNNAMEITSLKTEANKLERSYESIATPR